jgi:flagellar assembly factor FliW
MPQAETLHFGTIDYEDRAVVEFPRGLPAFENERGFVIIEEETTHPIVFLQSLTRPELVFMALPAQSVEPGYRLSPAPEDSEELGFEPDAELRLGEDVVALALVTVWDNQQATVNLMAPIVINVKTRRAVQVVQPWSGYSHQHPLGVKRVEAAEEAVAR